MSEIQSILRAAVFAPPILASEIDLDFGKALDALRGVPMLFPQGYFTTSSAATLWLNAPGDAQLGNTVAKGYVHRWSGSVIAIGGTVDVNAYTDGDVTLQASAYDGSSSTDLLATDAFGVSGVANGNTGTGEAAPGVHTFDAGDRVSIKRENSGTCTTDDITAWYVVIYDEVQA